MKRYMLCILALALAMCAFGQTTNPPALANPFPAITLPTAIAGWASFNQAGTPRFTGGLAAIYHMAGDGTGPVELYGATGVELIPKRATDPTTKRTIYAVGTNFTQELHERLFSTGRFKFLMGAGAGPTVSQGQTATNWTINLNADFALTAVYQITPAVSALMSMKMLYMTNIGWNPVPRIGFTINLGNLPKGQ